MFGMRRTRDNHEKREAYDFRLLPLLRDENGRKGAERRDYL